MQTDRADIVVRTATRGDAAALYELNRDFNGVDATTADRVAAALEATAGEIVFVAETNGQVVGFVCAQIATSFCYARRYAEISEVYVAPRARRRGIARAMIAHAERYCAQRYAIGSFSLKTGSCNRAAQALYRKIGYRRAREIVMRKRLFDAHGDTDSAE